MQCRLQNNSFLDYPQVFSKLRRKLKSCPDILNCNWICFYTAQMTKLHHLQHALNSNNGVCRYTLHYWPAVHRRNHLLHRHCESHIQKEEQEPNGSVSFHWEESQPLHRQHICSSGPAGSWAPTLCPAAWRAADTANRGQDSPLHHCTGTHGRNSSCPQIYSDSRHLLRPPSCFLVNYRLQSGENCSRMWAIR